MSELSRYDMQWLLGRIPRKVKTVLERHPLRYLIGGGFIRANIAKERVNDLDIFADSKESAQALINELTDNAAKKVHKTDNALSTIIGGLLVQVIYRWTFITPIEMLAHFDFTIAKAAIWYDPPEGLRQSNNNLYWKSMVDPNFYQDLAAKRLRFTGSDEPGASLLRVIKFTKRGYEIPLRDLAYVTGDLAKQVENGREDWPSRVARKLKEVDPQSPQLDDPSDDPKTPVVGDNDDWSGLMAPVGELI